MSCNSIQDFDMTIKVLKYANSRSLDWEGVHRNKTIKVYVLICAYQGRGQYLTTALFNLTEAAEMKQYALYQYFVFFL